MEIVPQLNDKHLKELIKIIGLMSDPYYVPVKIECFAKVNECFSAVDEKIKRDGGSKLFGWQIWKLNFLMEAEFHAIWKSDDGDLLDITPKIISVDKIAFLPDFNTKYTGAQVDNIRLNMTNNSIVDDFINIAQAEFKILNRGDRAFEYEIGSNSFSNDELKTLCAIQYLRPRLETMSYKGIGEDSDCFCSSGKKYKYCCHIVVTKIISL